MTINKSCHDINKSCHDNTHLLRAGFYVGHCQISLGSPVFVEHVSVDRAAGPLLYIGAAQVVHCSLQREQCFIHTPLLTRKIPMPFFTKNKYILWLSVHMISKSLHYQRITLYAQKGIRGYVII